MRIQTIFNRVLHFKSFVVREAKFEEHSTGNGAILLQIESRKNGLIHCSGCGKPRRFYDHLSERRFEFVPLWGIAVFLAYRMRRVNCERCGVKVEMVPWCDGKHRLTETYMWFLATWAKRLSWSEVASIFGTSWDSVCRSVEHAVEWGLAHRNLQGLKAIGIDEIARAKGHAYLILVYEIGPLKRLLAIAENRTEASLRSCLDSLGDSVCSGVQFVCSDMWRPYLNVISQKLENTVHILDRFHVMQKFGKALDDIRAEEAKQLKRDGYEQVLKHSRWSLLKRKNNLTEKQEVKLAEVLKYNLRTVRAYILREEFQQFWGYTYATWAERFLNKWTTRVMRSRLEPMKKVAQTLRNHQPLILNWFKARGAISSGVVEGLNNKVKVVTRKSYGFRSTRITKLALFHTLGHLPEPPHHHRFC